MTFRLTFDRRIVLSALLDRSFSTLPQCNTFSKYTTYKMEVTGDKHTAHSQDFREIHSHTDSYRNYIATSTLGGVVYFQMHQLSTMCIKTEQVNGCSMPSKNKQLIQDTCSSSITRTFAVSQNWVTTIFYRRPQSFFPDRKNHFRNFRLILAISVSFSTAHPLPQPQKRYRDLKV